MHLHAFVRSRLTPVYLVVAALAAAATVSSLAPVPQAQAQSGRRICKYLWMQGVGNSEGRQVSFVADYKKDGACPYIDLLKVEMPKDLGMWMPAPNTWEHQPAPKLKCEEFQVSQHLPSTEAGGDPCAYMYDDRLYGVTSWLAGDPNPPDRQKIRMWDLGSVWDLG